MYFQGKKSKTLCLEVLPSQDYIQLEIPDPLCNTIIIKNLFAKKSPIGYLLWLTFLEPMNFLRTWQCDSLIVRLNLLSKCNAAKDEKCTVLYNYCKIQLGLFLKVKHVKCNQHLAIFVWLASTLAYFFTASSPYCRCRVL